MQVRRLLECSLRALMPLPAMKPERLVLMLLLVPMQVRLLIALPELVQRGCCRHRPKGRSTQPQQL